MVLPVWLRNKLTVIRQVQSEEKGFVLAEPDFRVAVARERVRADRNGSPFAILVIELAADHSTRRDVAFLSKVLHRRLRTTDTAGYLANGLIAALLPDTPKAGAWKVASDVCDVYPIGHERPNCEVYVYPDETSPPIDESRQRLEQALGSVNRKLDSLFVYPTPMVKRALDVFGASLGLVVAAPCLLFMAILIKLTSRGPVFYSQLREGHGGRRFRIYKLRSMRADAERLQAALREYSEQDGPAFKMRHDPRITWIGRFLRRSSLDELPQLWNVLVGDMSLVGPRPLPVDESLQCTPWQRRRLAVVPGLTCVWQVRGRNTVSFDEWMRMDLQYLHSRSLFNDVRLLLSTVPALVLQRGPR